jgi:hypothetical protein
MITRVTEKCRCNGQTCQCAFLGFCMNINLPQYTAWGTLTCTHIPVLVQTKSKQVTLHESYMPFSSHRNSVCQMFIRMNVYVWNLTAARYQTHTLGTTGLQAMFSAHGALLWTQHFLQQCHSLQLSESALSLLTWCKSKLLLTDRYRLNWQDIFLLASLRDCRLSSARGALTLQLHAQWSKTCPWSKPRCIPSHVLIACTFWRFAFATL